MGKKQEPKRVAVTIHIERGMLAEIAKHAKKNNRRRKAEIELILDYGIRQIF